MKVDSTVTYLELTLARLDAPAFSAMCESLPRTRYHRCSWFCFYYHGKLLKILREI